MLHLNKFGGIKASVTGSSHLRVNRECQDYSTYKTSDVFAIAVVCDGHGALKHFRSAVGAKVAASVAIKTIKGFMKHGDAIPEDKGAALAQLEKNIILLWNNEINKHRLKYPFTNDELTSLSDRERKQVELNIEIAYGTTLVAVVLTNDYCFGIQIGDGDCLALDENGFFTNSIPEDDQLLFNITTSLSDKTAISNFRHFWHKTNSFSALIISTDGVINSFASEKHYHDFCFTVLEDISENDLEGTPEELTKFLKRLTDEGSGDDVSVAVIYNKATLGKVS